MTASADLSAMIPISGATFLMGSDHHYPEEAPAATVQVDGFLIDPVPVTNRQFAEFVSATGHVTLAERAPDPTDYPGASPDMLRPGSLVFAMPTGTMSLDQWENWWDFVFGADWRHPRGAGSDVRGLEDHPVVHVAHEDAVAYAAWAGKSLPTEAEWELAARGGLDGREFAWGDELSPGGQHLANTWQGRFPAENDLSDGWLYTSPVATYPPNGFGLYDMIGNVWEWTDDWYADRRVRPKPGDSTCCVPRNPRGGERWQSRDPATPQIDIPRKVLKGGSHLCAPNYCQRYRPAARYAQPIDTSTSHVGIRCVVRQPA